MDDYLEKAKACLRQCDVTWAKPNDILLAAIAHALVALCERLDGITGTPANQEGKALRIICKGK